MPAAISHWILGSKIINEQAFKEELPEVNPNAFLWGCQGPDIFFYHRLLPWQKNDSLKKYGGLLHGCDTTALFHSISKVCRYCLSREYFPLIYSYALGFCCHYCYDRLLHPLVYYNIALLEKTGSCGDNYNYHSDVEANMDIILLRRETGLLISELDIRDCLPKCENLDKAVAAFYTLLLMDIYAFRPSVKSVSTLASDFYSNISLLNDPHFVKKPVCRAVEKLIPQLNAGTISGLLHTASEDMSFDYANILKNTWFNPDDRSEKSNMNLYEITDTAKFDTLELMLLLSKSIVDKSSVDFAEFTRSLDFEGRKNS